MTSLEIEGDATQLAQDSVLAADVQGFTPRTTAGQAKAVLLTGATGFLGVFLLRELLAADLTVYCLVRADSEEAGRDRLRANLETYDLTDQIAMERIEIVPGDITLPRFGLAEDDYQVLSGQVDAVYHTAAKVNFLTPYKWLRKSTVSGIHEVLRFAGASRAALHHISTTGVFSGQTGDNTTPRGEHHVTGPAVGMPLGYTKSKWVAEQLLAQARDRGVPVTVHRPTQVWGDSRSGACQRNDFVWRFVIGSIQAGVYPRNFRLKMNLVPVDYVCAAVVAVSRQDAAVGGIFHQIGPAAIDSVAIRDFIAAAGYDLKEVSVIKWLKAISADVSNAMFPLIRTTMLMEQEEQPPFSDEITRGFLGGTGPDGTDVTCPAIDAALFATYAEFFVRRGFLPAP
ncbi:thioester reductase domain-containing protein [Nocardia sp. NPDC059240]|uniref:thioester reductase domain-containing protein n=1 Tax=Nocardia sp. NPDC059240 TaxID=3346786 RepID=UPI0036BA9D9E